MTPARTALPNLPPPPAGRTGWPWTEETPADVYDRAAGPAGWPRITIVCPSFQQGRFIEETIRSVLLQNYPALEFIVIDGGSDDGTVPLLQRYSPWLARWESTPDRGQAHALNKGFAGASGDLFGWINSDDYYLPGAFAAVARVYQNSPHRLFFGDWCERDADAPALITHRERAAFAFQVAVGGRHLPSHATFWPRSAHLPLDESLRFTLDADLFKRLAGAGLRPRHVPQPLAVFRRHPQAKTATLGSVALAETVAWAERQSWRTTVLAGISSAVERLRRAGG